MKTLFLWLSFVLLTVFTFTAVFAQTWPARPIRLIVAYGPGSGADIMARILAEKLSERLKVGVIVENREGAGGAIGTLAAARSAADGYTLILAPTTLTVSPHMQSAPSYDPVKDFAPIMRVAVLPLAVVTYPDAPYKTFKELIDYAKANPGKLSYATSGKGSPSHLEMELIRKRYGLNLRDVPYRNVGQAMTDAISGQVSFYCPTFPSALQHVLSGRVRGLAIGSPKRSVEAPALPTIAEEMELPGYEASVWYGLLAPAGTPQEAVLRLSAELDQVLAQPEVRQQIAKTGAQVAPMFTEDFADFVKSENTKWAGLVKELGLKDQN
jgi:tripartite-type tricarboxylate transporter receptor subunit TctC